MTAPPGFVPPRFGTKRNLSRQTRGGEVAEVSKRLGKPLMPWQQYAADVALEVDPETGELWYEEVVITVPRQSGKTTLMLAIFVWRCVVIARELGAQTCVYIAQSRLMARRKLEREFARLLRVGDPAAEVPKNSKQDPSLDHEWKLSMNNGSEHIRWGIGSYLNIEAPSETSSHGDVLDMPVTDEAWAREDDSVEEATDAATVTRRSPQSWIVSTVGNKRSRFLARKVLGGRAAIDDASSTTCYLEWSLADDEAYDDPAVWARRLPALGHTITEKRLLARLDKALRNPDTVEEDGFEPGLDGFRRGYMNQWRHWPDFGGEGDIVRVITPEMWSAVERGRSQIEGRVVFGVGVGYGGQTAALVVAGFTAAGEAQVETIDCAEGTWWIEKLARETSAKWKPATIAWDHGGPTRMVAPELQRAAEGCGAETLELNGAEWKAACAAMKQRVTELQLVHVGDVFLGDAVAVGEAQDVGDGWRWNVKLARGDVSSLLAATAALRALETMSAPAVDLLANIH
jgi:hypothetical protein